MKFCVILIFLIFSPPLYPTPIYTYKDWPKKKKARLKLICGNGSHLSASDQQEVARQSSTMHIWIARHQFSFSHSPAFCLTKLGLPLQKLTLCVKNTNGSGDVLLFKKKIPEKILEKMKPVYDDNCLSWTQMVRIAQGILGRKRNSQAAQ